MYSAGKVPIPLCHSCHVFGQKKWGYRCELAWVFGSNVPLAVLIDPWKFQVFPITGKNFPSQKPKHFWAKIGQNWPKSTMRVVQILRARTCRRARGLIFHHFIRIKISWGSAEEIIKIRPTVAELSVKNHFPIVNANPQIPGLTAGFR